MQFPIKLKDKNELNQFLKDNKSYILDFYHITKKIKKLKDKLKTRKIENKEIIEHLQKENKQLKELAELNKKQYGEHSMYKGEFDEKQKELILNNYFKNDFIIDGCKKMHCMDIRMKHKTNNYIIGIECKNKKNIIQKDVDKFKNDKLNNKFKASIFLSTNSPIKNIVTNENDFKFINDELYIYSKDINLIIILFKIVINNINNNLDENNDFNKQLYLDIIVNLYKNWCNIKKFSQKLDTDLVNSLKRLDLELVNGHIFLISKNKCKGNICPY